MIVPAILDAQNLDLLSLASKSKDLGNRARGNGDPLSNQELTSGTFSTSNLGMFGTHAFTAIIVPPQSGIIALGEVKKEAKVINDDIQIRQIMYATLSADHRVGDGAEGAFLMKEFKELLRKAFQAIIMRPTVKLVSYSQASNEFENLGLTDVQELIAFCARVSNPSNQLNSETSEKLINYLIKNYHWSPLEMVNVCLEIETTRDIARQILRHRSFSFQEFSQRYANPTEDLDFVIREARLQDNKNRQNSIENQNSELENEWSKKQKKVIENAIKTYEWAIENGIAKEQARESSSRR